MPFNVNNFLAVGLKYGGARPSKFDIQVTLPTNLAGIDPNATTKLNMTAFAASIPAFRIGVVPVHYFGRAVKTFGDRVWDDWRITVMLDQDYTTRAMLEAWNNGINALESNIQQASFDGEGYKALWNVTQYATDGTSPIRQYDIIGGWPRELGELRLDWNAADRISEFECTISFDNCAPSAGQENPWAFSTSTTYLANI